MHAARALFLITAASLTTPAPAHAQPAPPARQAESTNPDMAAGDAAFQREDWPAAVASYQAAIKAGLDTSLLHFRLGFSLHMLKRYDDALKHHLLATRIASKPLRIDALYNVACANALLGRKAEALKYLTHAIDTGFVDTAQVAKDTDLDSLRDDESFKTLAASIGKAPRLDQQLDFLMGTWVSGGEDGVPTQDVSFTRPLSGSDAIVTTKSVGGAAWTGVLIPDPIDRTWSWISADGIGTTMKLTGTAIQPNGARFEGRQTTIGGDGVLIRLTLAPDADTIRETAEVSDDNGATWRQHHESRHTRKSPKPDPATPR